MASECDGWRCGGCDVSHPGLNRCFPTTHTSYHKKVSKINVKNYRGISLLSANYKILSKALLVGTET